MPLIKCPDCGKEISDQAPFCPSCARPLQSFTPLQREVAKNIAGGISGCAWMIIGILILVLSPILVPLLVVAIAVPYDWIKENPVAAILIALAVLIPSSLFFLKARKR